MIMKKADILLVFFSLLIMLACGQKKDPVPWEEITADIERELNVNILDKWYPACLDTLYGGYLSNMSPQFVPSDRQNKMIVSQSRHLWTTSMVAKSDARMDYLKYASQGYPFLQKMWDTTYGGFFQTVDRSGKPIRINGFKTAYGNAFAIYGLSAYYDVSGDSTALDLAKKTFYWLDEHSHDPVEGGYFQSLTREGTVIIRNDSTPAISPIGYKDYNSSIHLLEALTSLYRVWPDPLVKERLTEMFHLVKDTMVNDRHYLDLYFKPDWEPISFYKQDSATIIQNAGMDHVSFGHDIETAYLLLEASEALELHDEDLLDELRSILDHSLYGWDKERGGLYDQGYYFDRDKPLVIIRDSKVWWAQAETLNTLLIFHQYYPEGGYDHLFEQQWNYLKKNVIDPVNGGWYTNGVDTRPQARNFPKASEWKTTYHNYRALANCLERLKK
jgi:mannobiose 2-epimerase